MSGKRDYTAEEWNLLVGAPFLAGLACSLADSTPQTFRKEMDTHIQSLQKAKETYKHNELIIAVLEEYYKEEDDETTEEFDKNSEEEESVDDSDEEVMTIGERLEELKRVAEIVDRKAQPEEAREFKQFLYDLAYKVADAAGEGFWGDWGNKISEQEKKFLEKLRTVLEITN